MPNFEQREVTDSGSASSGDLKSSIYAFPKELRGDNNWPFVMFSTVDDKFSCCLPIPQGIVFGDSATYSTINLGLIGQGVVGSIDEINKAAGRKEGIGGLVGAGVGGMAGNVVRTAGQMTAGAAASIAARNVLRMEDTANAIDFANKQIIAPNTNTNFQNVGIRSFAFTFKLVPKDKADTDSIKSILSGFREYIYPEGNLTVIQYPPKWKIQFYNATGEENQYMPKIYETYLTSFTSTYNSSSNMFHEDGSPIEVDTTMSFQETKALRRDEIKNLL